MTLFAKNRKIFKKKVLKLHKNVIFLQKSLAYFY